VLVRHRLVPAARSTQNPPHQGLISRLSTSRSTLHAVVEMHTGYRGGFRRRRRPARPPPSPRSPQIPSRSVDSLLPVATARSIRFYRISIRRSSGARHGDRRIPVDALAETCCGTRRKTAARLGRSESCYLHDHGDLGSVDEPGQVFCKCCRCCVAAGRQEGDREECQVDGLVPTPVEPSEVWRDPIDVPAWLSTSDDGYRRRCYPPPPAVLRLRSRNDVVVVAVRGLLGVCAVAL
jgi:hypothetical protein